MVSPATASTYHDLHAAPLFLFCCMFYMSLNACAAHLPCSVRVWVCAVFAVLGNLAHEQGKQVEQVVAEPLIHGSKFEQVLENKTELNILLFSKAPVMLFFDLIGGFLGTFMEEEVLDGVRNGSS